MTPDLSAWGLDTKPLDRLPDPTASGPPRTYFVYGPPGTGKTTYLTSQARRAAEEHGRDRVLIASLTRAAAAEVAGRDTGIPDDNVGTLHAHCYRALDRPSLAETPDGIRAWNDAHPSRAIGRGVNQLEDALTDTSHDTNNSGPGGGGDDVHHQVMTLRARMIPTSEWSLEQRAHHADWETWKQQTGRLDFTDLIQHTIQGDEPHPHAPRVLLVDEAQDCSRLELELVKTWARHTGPGGTTILVGDPDQAIYQWRGADPDGLRNLQLAGTRVLSQSYRVPGAVHHLAQHWVRGISDRADVQYEPTGQPGQVTGSRLPLRAATPVTQLIQQQLEDTPGTVMVLASCAYMLTPLISRLRAAGVPFHNPYRLNDGRWNPMRGTTRLKAFLRHDPRVWGDQARAWTWDDLRVFTDPLTAKNTMTRGSKTLIESRCAENRFGESQADEEVPTDRLMKIFGTTSLKHPVFHGDVAWWEANLRAKEARTAEYPIQVLRKTGPAALAATPRLILGTIHSVKGGEADTVIVAPDLSGQGYWHGWHPGGPGRDQIVRMLYVALTRARERVILLAPSGQEHARGLTEPAQLAAAA